MSLCTLMRLEAHKGRRQYLPVLKAALLLFIAAYVWFAMTRRQPPESGWMAMLYNMPVVDAVLLPLAVATLASRLCECEHKGSAFKLLETSMTAGRLFDVKYLYGLLHVAQMSLLQTGLLVLLGLGRGFAGPIPTARLAVFTGLTFAVCALLLSLQTGLSLLFANQLIPLTVGVGGSFLGLFILFFPPTLQRLLPWGYFGVLMQVGMLWNSQTRVASYYWADFNFAGLALLALWLAAFFFGFRTAFCRREV